MDIFFEIHRDIPREGPGSDEATLRAFALLPNLPPHPRILDIGCGPGMQTIALARQTEGRVTAVDTHQPFLDELRRRALAAGVSEKIETVNASMFSLDFEENSFDVIWSEGAIYIMGFEAGLRAWRPFLISGGYLVVSEITWLKPDPPDRLKRYWGAEYPGMRTLEENLQLVRNGGYKEIAHFVLPESAWWDHYYAPLEKRAAILRRKYREDREAMKQLDAMQLEMDIYREYSAWYGYVFYLACRWRE